MMNKSLTSNPIQSLKDKGITLYLSSMINQKVYVHITGIFRSVEDCNQHCGLPNNN